MRTTIRAAVLLALPALVLLGPDAAGSGVVRVGADVRVHDATPAEVDMVRWAVGRFRDAGLPLPTVDIYFHWDNSACPPGFGGFYENDRIDMCPGEVLNLIPRKDMLHELAHAWSVHFLSDARRRAFMQLRGLVKWNSYNEPWQLRGCEQMAEIVAWGIGDGVLSPFIPNNDKREITAAYELLTGSAPLIQQAMQRPTTGLLGDGAGTTTPGTAIGRVQSAKNLQTYLGSGTTPRLRPRAPTPRASGRSPAARESGPFRWFRRLPERGRTRRGVQVLQAFGVRQATG